ncbi:MAG: protein translocase subunit SecD [SAR86 cluster bacterium]|jgi:preprotein translocase subunit SecD|nr:protein translocase subunit SecD [Pseudomonadota bacterium]MDA8957903.1 protein translocase subunit SecD [Gammaproteobacteria bacterium]MDO7561475.1 protein translocase subunit SecD [SAR86 cluster bacterium]MDA9869493.1 protein translocase subunit SecD [Gammaproteobacteria bacterium]MDA9916848.1 protein translocase subunit SecD [Gammaproteobacteria bacterium]
MNRFSIGTHAFILIVLAVGIIYSLPNLYPAKPAIQIAYTDSGQSADQGLLNEVTEILSAKSIQSESIGLKDNNIVAKFSSFDDQLAAKSALQRILLDRAIVALNLEPSTPQWLRDIGGGPLKLGLDLSGGVHFLLEVDIESALDNRLDSLLNQYRKKFRDDRINVESSQKKDKELSFSFASDEDYNKALKVFGDDNITAVGTALYDIQTNTIRNNVDISYSQSAIKEIRDYAVGQNLMTLRNRVNELGVSEPIVQRQGSSRIVVELPGVQDTTAAKKIIGKTANLEFRLEAAPTTSRLRKEEFTYQDERMGSAYLEKNIIVAGERVTNASSGFDESGFAQVNISLDMQGGRAMQKATSGNIGRRLGVLFVERKNKSTLTIDENGDEVIEQSSYIEKNIISLATVQAVLGTGFRITGVGSPQEASELALLLRAGALAAPMKFVEERTVGPSLGKENIELGIRSIIIGLLSVVLFMVFYYRWFGLAANIALFANVVLITGFMSLLGATLTLPGIAGIVLTIGMAVDANVLIFSRIREELAEGRDPQTAIQEGFSRAFVTIFDANVTTLIASIVLYAIGTGPIKGFAITLSIGIITSMFTAILGTRAIINLMYGNKNIKELRV